MELKVAGADRFILFTCSDSGSFPPALGFLCVRLFVKIRLLMKFPLIGADGMVVSGRISQAIYG